MTKTRPVEAIGSALEASQLDFGENRVEELVEKSSQIQQSDIRWHFIGNLQSKKIKKLLEVKNLYAIHSIDRLSLLEKLQSGLEAGGKKLNIFLQVNTSDEQEKSGFQSYEELKMAVEFCLKHTQQINLQGLMTMSKLRTDDFEADAKICFSRLKQLKQKVEQSWSLSLELSMGMSADYPIALEMGTHWVRVGRKLFEELPPAS